LGGENTSEVMDEVDIRKRWHEQELELIKLKEELRDIQNKIDMLLRQNGKNGRNGRNGRGRVSRNGRNRK